MKRWRVAILVSVFAGLMTNIFLAWGIAIWSPRDWGDLIHFTPKQAVGLWHRYAPQGWLDNPEGKAEMNSTFGFQMLKLFAWTPPDAGESADSKLVVVWRSGWPWPAFYCRMAYRSELPPSIEKAWKLEWDLIAKRCWMVPYGPDWKGLIFNTLFFSTVYLTSFGGPLCMYRLMKRWRRSSRMTRGLCPVCAYPIGASPICTECGTPHCAMKDVHK